MLQKVVTGEVNPTPVLPAKAARHREMKPPDASQQAHLGVPPTHPSALRSQGLPLACGPHSPTPDGPGCMWVKL